MDKFGRAHNKRHKKKKHALASVGLKLTRLGDYDFGNKRLKNVKNPVDNNDVVNVNYLKSFIMNELDLYKMAVKKEIDALSVRISTCEQLVQKFIREMNEHFKSILEKNMK